MSINVSNAADQAWKRMTYLLWEKRSVRRWLALGFLGGLASASPAGSFNLNMPGDLHLPGGEGLNLAVVLGIVIVALVFGLVVGWLASVARFVFVENMVYDRHTILEPFRRLMGLGTRLFGFYMLVGLGLVGFFLVIGLVGAGLGLGLAGRSQEGAGVGIALLMLGAFFVVLIPVMIVVSLLFMITDDLVVPIMYKDDCGPVQGWRSVWSLFNRNRTAFFWWGLMRIVLALAWGTISLMLVLASMLLTGCVVGIVALPVGLLTHASLDVNGGAASVVVIVLAVLAFVALLLPQLLILTSPGVILTKSFSIYCLQQMDGDVCMLPQGGRLTVNEVTVVQEVLEPGFSPVAALPEEASSVPESSEWSNQP